MNTSRNLLHRLIKLYPVKTIKNHFSVDVDEAINKPEAAIKSFCYSIQ